MRTLDDIEMQRGLRGAQPPMVSASPNGAIEWPTLLLLAAVYLGFLAVTYWAAALGHWVAVPVLAILLAQHSSLQHEVLHGHPFGNQTLSDLTVCLPIGLAIPYGRFKHLHLRHHFDPNLTDPYDDPETNYLDPAAWARTGRLARAFLRMNNTLLGRMVLGPAIGLSGFYRSDLRQIAAGNGHVRRAWALHGLGVLAVAAWLVSIASMPVWAYLLAAYGAVSLLKIRTFLEHRAHQRSEGRSVIIEDRGPLALLFLNNNLHAVHHAHPGIAWYRLPTFYRARKQDFQQRNLGYCYRNYREIFGKYLLSAKDPVAHPLRLDGDARPNQLSMEQRRPTTSAQQAANLTRPAEQ